MAFYTLQELVQRTTLRLRQTPGVGAQLYSEGVIRHMLEETYQMVRAQRWWDHLTSFRQRSLDGVNGLITLGIGGATEGYRDVHSVMYGRSTTPLPTTGMDFSPVGMSGTRPRWVQPLHSADDPDGTLLFRVWPVTAVADTLTPLVVRVRTDPIGVFTDPLVRVPFDWTCLVNGAAAKYLADDGSNPAAQAMLDRTFNERLQQLQIQHDSVTLVVDGRSNSMWDGNQWATEP